VVITLAIRTPLTKGFKGGMKDTPLEFIVYTVLKQVLVKSRLDPQMIEDVCLGNVCVITIPFDLEVY
jgi:acetyl-CoA acyltransferase 1